MNVLNRSKDRDIAASLENESGRFAPEAALWQMNNPDLKATNTFGEERGPAHHVGHHPPGDVGRARYTFPAHSLTILKLKLRPKAAA